MFSSCISVSEQPIGDSCDASGEYTTEEDDLERQSSGDFNATVVNCHQSSETVPGDYDGTILSEKPSPSTLVPNTPEHTKVGHIVMNFETFLLVFTLCFANW